jgi:TonB family protein
MRFSQQRWFVFLAASAFVCSASPPAISQTQQEAATKRSIVQQSAPAYPPLARSMALQGVVRLEAVVSADGSVKTVDVRGGHPVLAQAAANAVRRWRWERASHETHEVVDVKFANNE